MKTQQQTTITVRTFCPAWTPEMWEEVEAMQAPMEEADGCCDFEVEWEEEE